MQATFHVTLELDQRSGKHVPVHRLAGLLAANLDAQLPSSLYVTHPDEDLECGFALMDSVVACTVTRNDHNTDCGANEARGCSCYQGI